MKKVFPTLIITFKTTAQAIKMEKYCHQNDIDGRLIPVPRAITAGCGLAWKTEVSNEQMMKIKLERDGILYENFHILTV